MREGSPLSYRGDICVWKRDSSLKAVNLLGAHHGFKEKIIVSKLLHPFILKRKGTTLRLKDDRLHYKKSILIYLNVQKESPPSLGLEKLESGTKLNGEGTSEMKD